VIAREAGAKVYGKSGRPLDDEGEVLMGRDFCVIRAVADAGTEKGSEIQDRLVKEFFDRVEEVS
jgi:hypothetical protein